MTFAPPSGGSVGWYPSPDGFDRWYFDGYGWHAPPPAPEPTPTLPWRMAVGVLVVLVASLVAAGALLDGSSGDGWTSVVSMLFGVGLVYGPSVLFMWWARSRCGLSWADLGWRYRWSDLGWGPLVWLAAVAVQFGLAVVVLIFDVPMSSNVDAVPDREVVETVATLVTAVIVAPVVEELIFRGVVLRGSMGVLPTALAIVVQGFVFGAAHMSRSFGTGNIGLVVVLGGVGCVFGAASFWFRRIGASVVGHAIFNAVVLVIVLLGLNDGFNAVVGLDSYR